MDVSSGFAVARIIIVNYNGGSLLQQAVQSALEQTAPVEVCLVDNGSTDDSVSRLAPHPKLTIVTLSENAGFGAGANRGASGATTPWLAFLNSDAVAAPSWIASMTMWMSERRIDMSAPLIGGRSGALYYAGGRWAAYRGAVLERHSATPPLSDDWISGCAFIMRTSTFEALGGFDERFFLYSEDVDLSLRARNAGAALGVFPERLVEHPNHGFSTDKLGEKKQEIAFFSRGRLIARHVPRYAVWIALAIQGILVPLRSGCSVPRTAMLARSMFRGYRAFRAKGVAGQTEAAALLRSGD